MQSILVLTDFSDAAFHAAQYAGMLSKSLNCKELILFHAYQTIPVVSHMPIVAAGQENLHEESLQTMEVWQESVRQFVNAPTEVRFLVDETDLSTAVNSLCREGQIDLVVMGITGKSNLEKIFIGSNTMRVMQNIHYPLLIVPQNTPDTLPDKVVLATDLKEVHDKMMIPSFSDFFDGVGGKLLVLNVADQEQDIVSLRTEITELHKFLDQYEPEFHYIKHPDTVEAINIFAVDHEAGLIVTFHEEHKGLAKLFHKSISKKLAWHSQIPLLVVPV